MTRYKILISYIGTDFGGWQIQPNAPSIQHALEKALHHVARETPRVIGSGRTDAGVHALGQVAHFTLEKEMDPYRLRYSLNALLPQRIRVMELHICAPTFHAQYDALQKEYHYHIQTCPVVTPFVRPYAWHIQWPLDFTLLNQAAHQLLGKHDFVAFANSSNEGTAAHDSIRTLTKLQRVEEPGGFRLEFEADGFLYKMVRNLTGTLIEIARERLPLTSIATIFQSRDRRLVPSAAPAHGLFLMRVDYPSLED